MSNITVSNSFVKPHFIEELGEEGLYAHEIAKALGGELKRVHEKLKRGKWHSGVVQEWRVVVYTSSNDSNGLPIESYALNTAAAKAFVARWESNIGDAYLNFLFHCEAEIPQLKERVKWLEGDVAALAANQKRVPNPTGKKRPKRIKVPYFHVSVMGGFIIKMQPRAKDECEPWQWEIGLIPWCVHVMQTLEAKIDKSINEAIRSVSQKFLPLEVDSHDQITPMLQQLVKDMLENPEQFTEVAGGKRKKISA